VVLALDIDTANMARCEWRRPPSGISRDLGWWEEIDGRDEHERERLGGK
jgi:hypothetical protein